MRTLLLASSGKFITENNIDPFLPKRINHCKIAYIITASKKVSDTSYMENHIHRMDELGFAYDKIDIAKRKRNELRKQLSDYDIIMVEGGNTFYLLKAVRESGFSEVIRDLIAKGIVYIGSSAGSYIACPSIIMATWSEHNFDHCGTTNYQAMNLVPFLIKAHYTPDMKKMLSEKAKNLSYPLRLISDNQALLVRNAEVQLIGTGPELII